MLVHFFIVIDQNLLTHNSALKEHSSNKGHIVKFVSDLYFPNFPVNFKVEMASFLWVLHLWPAWVTDVMNTGEWTVLDKQQGICPLFITFITQVGIY